MKETIFLPETIIDQHCHGRDMDQKHKTTVMQTLREAQKGNIGITVFMPNTNPPIIGLNALRTYTNLIGVAEKYIGLKNKQYLYFGATEENYHESLDALYCESVVGIKIYPYPKGVTTGSPQIGISGYYSLKGVMVFTADLGKVVAVHCDDPEIIAQEGHTKRAEVSYLLKVIEIMNDIPKAKVVICHVSCRDSAEIILQAQQRGLKIAMELCPHYLWFDDEGTNWNPNLNPVFYHCYNKIRSKNDRHYLTALLKMNNPLIFIGSDNAPHTEKEKFNANPPGGLPGNQEMVAVIVTLALKLGISEKRLADLLCHNVANFLGIPVSKNKKEYRLVKKIDDITYNNGIVVNPWNGSEFYFPIPIK